MASRLALLAFLRKTNPDLLCHRHGVRRTSDAVFEPGALSARPPWGQAWSPRGVIEVLEPMVVDPRKERILQVLAERKQSVTVLMDAPHDPHNGAAVLRSCDAFGLQELHVIPRREPFLASNMVAKGAERWVDLIEHQSPREAAAQLEARGFELIATHPAGELVPEDLEQVPRLALVLGNEHDGIGEELRLLARRSVRIPMVGFVESLNVSVSAALLLWAATRGRPGDLGVEARERLYARALYHSVKRARDVLQNLTPR